MQKACRIRKKGQFRYVFRRGKTIAQPLVSLSYVRAGRLQAGFSVSTKGGNAVKRNLIKRRMRECFRLQMGSLKSGYYVFTARPPAAQADYHAICRDMGRLLSRMQLYRDHP